MTRSVNTFIEAPPGYATNAQFVEYFRMHGIAITNARYVPVAHERRFTANGWHGFVLPMDTSPEDCLARVREKIEDRVVGCFG